MLDLFYEGGPLFMGLLTIILIVMLSVTFINGMPILKGSSTDHDSSRRKISTIKSIGLFALVIGVLGQLIGLFSAFRAIELGAVEVSPVIIASGFKISMITTIYGLIIYILSFLLWFGLNMKLGKK